MLMREAARKKREALKEQWAQGGFSASFDMEMAVKNASATGACSVLIEFEAPNYQDMIDEVRHDEQERPETGGPRGADQAQGS